MPSGVCPLEIKYPYRGSGHIFLCSCRQPRAPTFGTGNKPFLGAPRTFRAVIEPFLGSRGALCTAGRPYFATRATFGALRMPPILAKDTIGAPQIAISPSRVAIRTVRQASSLLESPFRSCDKPLQVPKMTF